MKMKRKYSWMIIAFVFLAIFALSHFSSGEELGGQDELVQKCLKAWQDKEFAHGGGEVTLFDQKVTVRSSYTVVDLTLGTGEGRRFNGACRIKDGRVTHLYD